MEEISALVAAETVAVLNRTEVDLVATVSYKLIKALEEKAEEYDGEVILDEKLPLNEQRISDEARAVLAIIYREYWCDEIKKAELDKMIIEQDNKFNEEESKRLDPFKHTKIYEEKEDTEKVVEENKALIELPKKWYVRIFDRIMRFFRKR